MIYPFRNPFTPLEKQCSNGAFAIQSTLTPTHRENERPTLQLSRSYLFLRVSNITHSPGERSYFQTYQPSTAWRAMPYPATEGEV